MAHSVANVAAHCVDLKGSKNLDSDPPRDSKDISVP